MIAEARAWLSNYAHSAHSRHMLACKQNGSVLVIRNRSRSRLMMGNFKPPSGMTVHVMP